MLKAAEVAWAIRRKSKIPRHGKGSGLLDLSPEQAMGLDIFVCFYKGPPSAAAENKHSQLLMSDPDVFSKLTYFEDCPGMNEEHRIISVCLDDPTTFIVDGAYEVQLVLSPKNKEKFASLHYVKRVRGFNGLSFTRKDAQIFADRLLQLAPEKIKAVRRQKPWYVPFDQMLSWLPTDSE
jgi:hypothetical protein